MTFTQSFVIVHFMIKAHVHTDDHLIKADFDATEAFQSLSDTKLLELAESGLFE